MTPYVRMLSAAFSTAGRSIIVLGALLCTVHTCEGLASYTLTPTTEGMQLKTPRGKIVDETDNVSVAEVDRISIIDLTYRIAPVVDFVVSPMAFGGFAFQAQTRA